MSRLVLVTGGGGFIGSHCIVELLNEGFSVLAIDNWSNSSPGKILIKFFSMINAFFRNYRNYLNRMLETS